jgi:hypothetical protein
MVDFLTPRCRHCHHRLDHHTPGGCVGDGGCGCPGYDPALLPGVHTLTGWSDPTSR